MSKWRPIGGLKKRHSLKHEFKLPRKKKKEFKKVFGRDAYRQLKSRFVPSINGKFLSVHVQGETREIRVNYTHEMAGELHAFHGIDISRETEELMRRELMGDWSNE